MVPGLKESLIIRIYIYMVPPQMSTSFGFDWYLQCFMHMFDYKKSNKKSTSQFNKQ